MKNLLSLSFVILSSVSFAAAKSASETASLKLGDHELKISYSAPSVKGRTGHIFTADGLIGHDSTYPVWRAGANGATTLHTDTELTVGELTVPKGDYTLYVDVKNPDKWVLIINKELGQWGTKYTAEKDLGRVPMQMSKPAAQIETLKYELTGTDKKGTLQLAWENHVAKVPFTVK